MNTLQMSLIRRSAVPAVVLCLSNPLSGCSWVDSTGAQKGDGDSSYQQSSTLPLLSADQPIALLESASTRFRLSDPESTSWQWQAQGNTDPRRCAAIEGFDAALAATSLDTACSDAAACEIDISSHLEVEQPYAEVRMPRLRAPIALHYLAISRDAAGIVRQHSQVFCGLSINEAPEAVDDSYALRLGEALIVTGSDSNHLLQNDSDDDDIRNQTLVVLPEAERAPAHAAEFHLQGDGGFYYLADDSSLASKDFTDSFEYRVSDGLHESTATVYLSLITENAPPQLLQRIEHQSIRAGESLSLDLGAYFSDPDGDTLHLDVELGTLASGEHFSLDHDQVLRGEAEASDSGRHLIRVIASDGHESIDTTFLLIITTTPNQPPLASDIPNRQVSGSFEFDVSEYFHDPDEDTLQFTASNLPPGSRISTDGIVSGEVGRHSGNWLVNITATDPEGLTVSDRFRLRLR